MVAKPTAGTIGRVMGAAAALLVVSTTPAAAYLDPGTGSMVLQALIGAVVGGLITIRIYWGKIKRFFGMKSGDSGELDAAEQRSDEHRPS